MWFPSRIRDVPSCAPFSSGISSSITYLAYFLSLGPFGGHLSLPCNLLIFFSALKFQNSICVGTGRCFMVLEINNVGCSASAISDTPENYHQYFQYRYPYDIRDSDTYQYLYLKSCFLNIYIELNIFLIKK